MPSTKYFLVKYKYKYFDISIHQVLKLQQVLINMYLSTSTSTVLDPNPGIDAIQYFCVLNKNI